MAEIDYKAMRDAHGKTFDRFIEERTLEYVLDLHLKCDFALNRGLHDHEREKDRDD